MAKIKLEIPCKYVTLILFFSELCVNLNENCAKTTHGSVQPPSVWVSTGIGDLYAAVDRILWYFFFPCIFSSLYAHVFITLDSRYLWHLKGCRRPLGDVF